MISSLRLISIWTSLNPLKYPDSSIAIPLSSPVPDTINPSGLSILGGFISMVNVVGLSNVISVGFSASSVKVNIMGTSRLSSESVIIAKSALAPPNSIVVSPVPLISIGVSTVTQSPPLSLQ